MDSKPIPTVANLVIMWVLWASFTVGIFFFYTFLGQNSAPAPIGTETRTPWLIAGTMIFISSALRWIVLPRMHDAQKLLVTMIAGIALAESVTFLGLFVFPAYRLDFFVLSALGIFQFIPTYARRQLGLSGSSDLRE